MQRSDWFFTLACSAAVLAHAAVAAAPEGYYRFPALHRDTIVFTAEGDLWRVGVEGGVAQRLTSHPGTESRAAFSGDGKLLAFSAEYEGPTEVYTMPAEGGAPTRRTFEGSNAWVVGWTPKGQVIYTTRQFSTLPNDQLATIDLKGGEIAVLPLHQASEGVFDGNGRDLFFTRLPFQGSNTKRYRGGTAQNLWRFTLGGDEAKPLTADYPGTSRSPLWWKDRIYFVSDRDGTLNLWSMKEDGTDVRQLTDHKGLDVKSPSLSEGRIVYQLGADLHWYDIAGKKDRSLTIALASDFDHLREKWVKKPLDFLTSVHLSPNGDRLVLTARGQVFVAPTGKGRLVQATHKDGVRYRNARFMPDGKDLVVLSDESGELEFELHPASGLGESRSLTGNGKVFRFDGVPSPDGKRFAFHDKNRELWVLNVKTDTMQRIDASGQDEFRDLRWSPDSQWLAYARVADNTYTQLWVYNVTKDVKTAVTSDRVNSSSPAWTADGRWLYFLSERHLQSLVPNPWGPRQPEPFLDRSTGVFLLSLTGRDRSPFEPPDELTPVAKKDTGAANTNKPVVVAIELDGIRDRALAVPIPAGNLSRLAVAGKHLLWLSRETGSEKRNLTSLEISNEEPRPVTLVEDVKGFEVSDDGKKVMVHKGDAFHVIDAASSAPAKLDKSVDLSSWTFTVNPRQEWRQMFVEAWRLERDYFYDRNMHNVDWPKVLKRYLPLVDRVTDREELSDLVADMVSELSALHIFVRGGDTREGADQVKPGSLGAVLVRDEKAGGYRVDRVYQSDPDYPDRRSPLAKPGVQVVAGDIIQGINGVETLSVPHPSSLLRNQAGRQVLLRVKPAGGGRPRDAVVTPITVEREADLRYDDWEYTRRQMVETLGGGKIGYVHLRAMGGANITEWMRDYYPVFKREGLLIDVRHNRGGNIDSWILGRLLRKAWFYWQPRVGDPYWNMQYAFRGHLAVLCNERTASDGEAFTEGFRRLGLGKVIGTRTWGGEIWLSMDNWLVDKGIASAAETGVYGPEGKWLIEGHGVDPDIVVDNLPHATFKGDDAQLKAAVTHLLGLIREKPVTVPAAPAYPDKAVK